MPPTTGAPLFPPRTLVTTHVSLPRPPLRQKEEALVRHKRELLEYREYGAVVVCCHNQLQKAIHKDYLAELEDARLGLAKKSPKEIFDHVIS